MPDLESLTPAQRKAAIGYEQSFARVLRADAQRVELGYDLEPQRWPWLALSPVHPVVLDKIQYFSALAASFASGGLEPGTRSALTRIRWSVAPGPSPVHHAVRGVLVPWSEPPRGGYTLTLVDAERREIATVWGEGQAFVDRDFGAWRARSKDALRARATPPPGVADPVAAGLGPHGHCLVCAPSERAGERFVVAWVGIAGGFHPAHPFHTGTGDHVNAAHLLDCALQATHLMDGRGTPLVCSAGEAEFLRFVELDVPFELRLDPADGAPAARERWRFRIHQADRENARVTLELTASGGARR